MLVEHPDEATGLAIASGLRFAGYAVAVCPGPRGHGQCPLTGPAGCAPAHDADLVVCSLGYEHEAAREVLRELRTRYPDMPLLVEVPSEVDADLQRAPGRLPPAASTGDPRAGRGRRAEPVRSTSPKRALPMRSPFHSEPEAFRSVLLLILALIPVVLAAALGPTWLALVVLAVVLGALAVRVAQLRMRKLRGLELPVKMAPPHLGSAAERRVLVVANDTLSEEALLGEVERLASVPRYARAPARARADLPRRPLDRRGRRSLGPGARPPEDGPRPRRPRRTSLRARSPRRTPSKPSRTRSPPSRRMKSSSPLAGSGPRAGSSRGSRVSCASGSPCPFVISSSSPAPPRRSRTGTPRRDIGTNSVKQLPGGSG